MSGYLDLQGGGYTDVSKRNPLPVGFVPENTDVFGRLKITRHQNVYDADFEYGTQPLRWEGLTFGAGTITHLPNQGGVRMRLTTASGDVTIRQSRPYQRYQPGKSMFMASAVTFGSALANQVNRIGFFDDSNGLFFEQNGNVTATNPSGMCVVVRSDVGGTINETRVTADQWNGDSVSRAPINWNNIQMVWIEYAWYGAGTCRFGVTVNGRQILLHAFAFGNLNGNTNAWCRTGNLPVRYEQRNTGVTTAVNDMILYGVSVMVEGQSDDQRGFTYSYGMALGTPTRTVAATTTRYPILSIRNRVMGTIEYTQASSAITAATTTSLTVTGTPFTVNQWQGRFISYIVSGVTYVARITSNTTSVLTLADIVLGLSLSVAPVAGQNYTIGLLNRGQILPRTLILYASAVSQIEIISSTPTSPVVLTGASFAALNTLGSASSFAERDVSATAMTGGEVVMKFTSPSGGSGLQSLDLSNLFPLYNTIRGNVPDVLTIAVTTKSGGSVDVGADIICQEPMS